MEAEAINGRIYLIPPKGLLQDFRDVIEDKFNGGTFKYIERPFPLPPRNFEIELVVDDDCEVCPTAVEITAELVAMHNNITAKMYNITYVDPPFSPIDATPAFRVNKRVIFYGVPLDPKGIREYFMNFLKEAYIITHPRLQELLSTLKKFSDTYGYHRNPNDVAFANIIYRLLKNIDEYGYPYCPCRPLKKVEGATPEEIYEMNKDKVCPCPYAHTDIKTKGQCLCKLFWSKEKVDEYIQKRLKEYGWIIKEIDNVQKALEDLKKKVITGDGKMLAESILNKMQVIYLSLPD